MKGRIGLLLACLLSGCATRKMAEPIGYLLEPDAQVDKLMVDDVVDQLWPHCSKDDYGNMQMDSRLVGQAFTDDLTAGLLDRGCNIAMASGSAPTGTTIISYLVDSAADPSERRLMIKVVGSTMSRLYSRLNGQWIALATWSKSSTL